MGAQATRRQSARSFERRPRRVRDICAEQRKMKKRQRPKGTTLTSYTRVCRAREIARKKTAGSAMPR